MCEVSNLQTSSNSKKQPHFGELLGRLLTVYEEYISLTIYFIRLQISKK